RPDAPPDAPPRKRTVLEYTGMTPGFIKRATVDSWTLDKSYTYSYVFSYIFAVPKGASTITLPECDKIHIYKVTAADERPPRIPPSPLYDVGTASAAHDWPQP